MGNSVFPEYSSKTSYGVSRACELPARCSGPWCGTETLQPSAGTGHGKRHLERHRPVGLLGVIIGILTIVLSKNRKNRVLTWSVFVSSAVAVLVAAASVIGLMVSLVKTIIHGDKRLLAYCSYSDGRSHLTIANECPFDPTRIFSTTIVLWVPLILMSAVDMVFSCRLFKVSISYLGLPWCLRKQHLQDESRLMKTPRAAEPCYSPSSRRFQEDEERKLSVIRPPERHRPPYNSRPHSSVSYGQYRQHHSASPFNRAALERSSIWI
ncbi:keratinocyte-associated protein 3-like [Sinocyclocheilus grahami]|uniref:keratinocyte-associated protein 3-like n=1 Tax=Sinocyclocheilus grahami TaxID=75366 RepID=UPI0007AD22A2|nr:PREDICTED: keratinocyte-associated protein 3-like [Sinocyclocheilus grahami]